MSRMVAIISGPELIQETLAQRGKVSIGLTSPRVKYFLKSWRWCPFEREKEQCKVRKPASMTVCWFVSACGMGNLHSIKAPLRFWNLFFAVQMTSYCNYTPAYLSGTTLSQILRVLRSRDWKSELSRPACWPDAADTHTMWPIMKCKIWWQHMESVGSLNANFKRSKITVKNTIWVLEEHGNKTVVNDINLSQFLCLFVIYSVLIVTFSFKSVACCFWHFTLCPRECKGWMIIKW